MSIKALNWAFSTYVDNPNAKLVLIALANFASHPRGVPEGKEECWPAQSKMAEITSLGKRTIIRNLKVLVDLGLISVRREPPTLGRFEQNVYVLNMAVPSATVTPGPGANLAHGTKCQSDTSPGANLDKNGCHSGTCSINHVEPLKENRANPATLVQFSPRDGSKKPTPPLELEADWKDAVDELTLSMDKQTCLTWLPPLRLVSKDPWLIVCPNDFFVEWWQQPQKTALMRSALDLAPDHDLRFVSRSDFSVESQVKTL